MLRLQPLRSLAPKSRRRELLESAFTSYAIMSDACEWVNSKAGFHGYCVWVRPKDDCEAQTVTQGIMQQFTRRFPPLLMPTWQPHICLAAGVFSPQPLPPPPFTF